MPIVKRRPRNPSLRFQSYLTNEEITKKTPEGSLVKGKKRCSGRNCFGRITVRHRGGGAKRAYRYLDFKRSDRGVQGRVASVEYDPNRSALIGLLVYQNGAKRYVIMPQDMGVGDTIVASEEAEAKVGSSMPLNKVPLGFFVHNIEMYPGSGGKLVRAAGARAQVVGTNERGEIVVKMPSSEVRLLNPACWATIGTVGRAERRNISIGKAGRTRRMGFRPTVRGVAMNPIDHPHGGGEGRSKSGSHPVSPWAKGCKGTRTVRRVKKYVIRRRSK